MDEAFVKPTMD